MRDRETRDRAKTNVLVDNTAQTVHKHLSKLAQEEPKFRNRWIWELLQNARDVAPAAGVQVWLVHQDQTISFRHNGVPFTDQNVAHLIYHGSTKADESEPDAVGQFGTGFLTTHLLSKTVTVTGRTDEGYQFRFLLDRRGDTARALKDSMDASWDAFNASLAKAEDEDGFTTSYDYPLDQGACELASAGIKSLTRNAAHLLAFNERIASIRITSDDRTRELRKVPEAGRHEGAISIIAIEQRIDGMDADTRYVGTVADGDVTVAVELALGAEGVGWRVLPCADQPRVFVAFPLTATDQFCLPVVMNSETLQPREDRDALVLTANREGQHPNMAVLERACALAAKLAVLAASAGWEDAAQLASITPPQQWDWLDVIWFRLTARSHFVEKVRSSSIVETASGVRVTPSAAWFPLPNGDVTAKDVWDVACGIADSDSRLPKREEAEAWARIVGQWSAYYESSADEMPESLTLAKMCAKIAACKTLGGVKALVKEEEEVIGFLNATYALLAKAAATSLLSRHELIPSQSGSLMKLTDLWRDGGIDESLKDIAEQLGLAVRSDIADRRVRCGPLAERKQKEQHEVIAAAVQRVREGAQGKALDERYEGANVALFAWLVRHREFSQLDGYPVLTQASSPEDAAVMKLARGSEDQPLSPPADWPEAAQAVADLFPKGQTLADAYHDVAPETEFWQSLSDAGYIRRSPLFLTRRKHIPFIPDEPLPVSEKDKKFRHRTKDAVEVQAIAYFEKDETGLDSVRRSKQRAAGLLTFLSEYVLSQNPNALEPVEAECECGEQHSYYRAAWMIPLWERQWVPLGGNKQAEATAESIAQLFAEREDELRQITTGKGRDLMKALGIGLAELSLHAVAKDDESRMSLIDSLTNILHAAKNDAERVRILADELRESPELLDVIHEHRDRREKVRRNQAVGAAVEQLLKRLLETHGLRVGRTGIGSDFEVESDFVEGEAEMLLTIEGAARSYLVEVKASRADRVRMTVAQAEKAVTERERFVLCMVKLEGDGEPTADDVEAGCRFVFGIAERIDPVWNDYSLVEDLREDAAEKRGDVELVMKGAETRFAVSMELWNTALTVEQAAETFRGAPSTMPSFHAAPATG